MSPMRHCLMLLAGLLAFPVCQTAAVDAPSPAKPLSPDQLFARAIENLAGLEGVEIRFQQNLPSPGMKYRSEGRYLRAGKTNAGDGEKFFLEFVTRLGDSISTQQHIADGAKLWLLSMMTAADNGKETFPVSARYLDLAELERELKRFEEETGREKLSPAQIPIVVREIRNELGFNGVTPMLAELKSKMTFTRLLPHDLLASRPTQVLVGDWLPEVVEQVAPNTPIRDGAKETWADLWRQRKLPNTPRQCLVFLEQPQFGGFDPQTVRPYRVEWLGLVRPQGRNEVLYSVEFKVGAAVSGEMLGHLLTIARLHREEAKQLSALELIERKRDEVRARDVRSR